MSPIYAPDFELMKFADRIIQDSNIIVESKLDAERAIAIISDLFAAPAPEELREFYFTKIVQFYSHEVLYPGRRESGQSDTALLVTLLDFFKLQMAIPLFGDGCGNYFALSYSDNMQEKGVYFFGHENSYSSPMWAAASTIGKFLELAILEDALGGIWPHQREQILSIDPRIAYCKRAPPIWEVDDIGNMVR